MRFLTILTATALISTLMIGPAFAVDAVKGKNLRFSQFGDTELSCGALSREALRMRDIIVRKDNDRKNAEMREHGITAAAGIGSFLIGTATGGIGFAAAGFIAAEANEDDAEKAEAVQDLAEQRRSLMIGIFNAKGCAGPINHVVEPILPYEKREPEAHKLNGIEPAGGRHAFDHTSNRRYND